MVESLVVPYTENSCDHHVAVVYCHIKYCNC